jgi:Zn-dependent M28 family amino/carboxypeptidase
LALPRHVRPHPTGSDHWPFAQAGVPAVWLQRLPDAANHTRHDLPANLDPAALAQAGQLLTHTLLSIDADDLTSLEHPRNLLARS